MYFPFFTFLILLLITAGESRKCFNCSSVHDYYCPEYMTGDDESIIQYVSCDGIYDGRFCIKTTGINGGGSSIRCFRCGETPTSPTCFDQHFNASLSSCSDTFEANYCIKTLEEPVEIAAKRNLGTTRFCSSRDMGNYCEYIRRPGDSLEYRSCVFTCSSDGCNSSSNLKFSILLLIPVFSNLFIC